MIFWGFRMLDSNLVSYKTGTFIDEIPNFGTKLNLNPSCPNDLYWTLTLLIYGQLVSWKCSNF